MFQTQPMTALLESHAPVLKRLHAVEKKLRDKFYGMDDAVRALVLAAACGEPLLLVGPPGTAKSLLIREFCRLLGLRVPFSKKAESKALHPAGDYFEYLLTPFTEPGELFGALRVSDLIEKSEYTRLDSGMLQKAKVVYLDEVFNASSAILNTLLAVMNEGGFHDYGNPVTVQVKCFFGASNSLKLTQELRAFADRFVLRHWVENTEPKHLGDLLEKGWTETFGEHVDRPDPALLNDLETLRNDIRARTATGELKPDPQHTFCAALRTAVDFLRRCNYSEMSNRRLVKLSRVVLIHALYRAVEGHGQRPEVGVAEFELVRKYFVDRRDPELIREWENLVRDWQHRQAML